MTGDEIKNNPQLNKIKEKVDELDAIKKAWPLIKPFAKKLGIDETMIEEKFEEVSKLKHQAYEMIAIPDKFNELFSDIGWIFIESMELEAAKKAIDIAESGGVEQADEFLADYYSPVWVETRINWLKYIPGFQPRFSIASKALEDYKAGRYYASVLVTLGLIDGWVSELNIVDYHRQGFFSEKSQLVAWDSIAAHPKGLMKLKEVFSKVRLTTRQEEIKIPYRHGIVHGMDFGYDNKFVAAKCWAALFGVREWVIKYSKGEMLPPITEPQKEISLWESIEGYLKARSELERIRAWKPRAIIVGKTVPFKGITTDFPKNTPEQKFIEFMNYWLKNNYGYMAGCFAPMLKTTPAEVRNNFEKTSLIDYELLGITDVMSWITDIQVKVKLKKSDIETDAIYEFRIACNNKDGALIYFANDVSVWGITSWRMIQT